MPVSTSTIAHGVLSWLSRFTKQPERVIVAFHESPSRTALEQTLDVLEDVAGPILPVGDIVAGARGCALTFDDGDRSIIEVAAPVLAARGLPASAYVVAGLIGTRTPFWWVEVEQRAGSTASDLIRHMKAVPDGDRLQLLKSLRRRTRDIEVTQENLTAEDLLRLQDVGITVGNHSFTHPLLDRCPDDKVRQELSDAHELLTDVLAQPPVEIAYPNGNEDARVISTARTLGYEVGLLFDHAPVGRIIDPLQVSRIRLDVGAPRSVVRSHASGLHPRLHEHLGRT